MSSLSAPPPVAPAAGGRRLAHRVRGWLAQQDRFPLWVFVASRTALIGFSYLGLTMVPGLFLHESTRHAVLKPHPALDGLCRWDCGWFEKVLREGFHDVANAQVFPLYPALGWLLTQIGMNRFVALIVIANAASFFSFVFIYRIFAELEGVKAARAALLVFVAFPFAFFQAAGYSDSLMVCASALAIWLALRGRHVASGVALGLGVLARHVTLFAGAGLLAAQIRQRPSVRRFLASPALLGLVIPWLCLGGWAIVVGHWTGSPRALLIARDKQWGEMAYWSVADVFRKTTYARHPEYFHYMVFALIPIAGTVALATRRRWAELAAAAGVLIVVCLGSGAVGLGRYAGTCWPAFLPLGVVLARRPALLEVVVAMLMLSQAVYFFLFTHQFPIL